MEEVEVEVIGILELSGRDWIDRVFSCFITTLSPINPSRLTKAEIFWASGTLALKDRDSRTILSSIDSLKN